MAWFDLQPKVTPAALFGRKEELAELTRLVVARRWTAVLGPRMVGKTSLLRAAEARYGRPGVYVNLWGVRTSHALLAALLHGLNASRGVVSRIRNAAARIDGISVGPSGLSVSVARRPMKSLWDLLDAVGSTTSGTVIELDEVQELLPISGRLLTLLGNIFNTYPHVVFVFTGSYFGLLRTLLEPGSTSPMYGRSPARLELRPFDRPTAIEFLRRGFAEQRISLSETVLAEAVDRHLGGIPGWLSLYGNNVAVRRLGTDRALKETVAEGTRVVREEVHHFLEGRSPPLYWKALKAAANGATWSEIRRSISDSAFAEANDGTVGRVLDGLKAAAFVTEQDGTYRIADPMLRTYLLSPSFGRSRSERSPLSRSPN